MDAPVKIAPAILNRTNQLWIRLLADAKEGRLDAITNEDLLGLNMETSKLHNWSNFQPMPNWMTIDLVHDPVVRSIIVIVYVVIILVGCVFNVTVIFLVARRRRLRTVTNIFIANLALSDLFLISYSLPVQLHYQLTDRWVFGSVLCRIIFTAFAVPMYVSTASILVIAIDRFCLIVHPLCERMSRRAAFAIIAANVLLSIGMSVPVMTFTKLQPFDDDVINIHMKFCVEEWPSASRRRAYTVMTFLLLFFLPLVISSALYCRIYARLRRRPPGLHLSRTTRTNRLLLLIVVVFIVCWLPWNIFSLVIEFNSSVVAGHRIKLIDLSLKAFALGSACVNPFLYCWLNDNFRAELSAIAVQLGIFRARPQAFTAPGTADGGSIGLRLVHLGERMTSSPAKTTMIVRCTDRPNNHQHVDCVTATIANKPDDETTRTAIVENTDVDMLGLQRNNRDTHPTNDCTTLVNHIYLVNEKSEF